MLQKTLTLLISSALVSVVACSSSDEQKYPSVDSFCAAKADALCSQVATGCGTTTDKCKPLATSSCVSQSNALGRPYTATAAEDCINKTRDVYAKKNVTQQDEKDLAAACAKVFPGTKQKAESCKSDDECTTDLVCDAVDHTCATKTLRQEKDQCNNAGDTCVEGTYCQPQGQGRSYCVKKNAEGDICGSDKPCLETLRCLGNTVCKPKANIGEACSVDDDCSATAGAPYCDTVSKQCKQRYTGGTQSCKDIGG